MLFATGSFDDPYRWRDDFNSFEPELINFLAGKGVRLIGIDTPSVDPANSKPLETHNAIYKNDLAILEGLYLTNVPEGEYFLSALPLAVEGGDSGPVRAGLWPLGYEFA